jgi:hypothetical protein
VDETPTGNAVFALASGAFDVTGTLTIDPVDPDEDNVVVGILDDSETSLSVELAPGDYNATLSAWVLTEVDGPTRTEAEPLDVDLVTVTPAPFAIATDADTPVSINFTIGTDPLVFVPETDGQALVSLSIIQDDGCVDACDVGEVCVSIDGGAATCEIECETPGVDEVTCGEFGVCIEGDEGSDLNICETLI